MDSSNMNVEEGKQVLRWVEERCLEAFGRGEG